MTLYGSSTANTYGSVWSARPPASPSAAALQLPEEAEHHPVAAQGVVVIGQVSTRAAQGGELLRLPPTEVAAEDGLRPVGFDGLPPDPAVQPVQRAQSVEGGQHVAQSQSEGGQADHWLQMDQPR